MSMFGMDEEQFKRMLERIMYPELSCRSMKKDYDINKNVNSEICAECGGKCCKICGCHFSPDDFEEISFDYLKKEMEKGYISIDYVDGEMLLQDFGVYLLRIRNAGAPVVDTGHRRGTPCILLTETGCKLSYERRPTGGKLLIPSNELYQGILSVKPERRCTSTYSIEQCCWEWKPHQRLLHDLLEYFKDLDVPCSL